MTALAWNCRGLGNQSAVAILSKLLKLEAPSLVFLCETKKKISEIRLLNNAWGFKNVIGVDCVGPNRKGGLALMWDDTLNIYVLSLSLHVIDVRINEKNNPLVYWRFSGLYGRSAGGDKHNTWDLPRSLKAKCQLPWFCIGDFNEILWPYEKHGGRDKRLSTMQAFREALDDCGLIDLGYKGAPFTWCNNQRGDSLILERLDRGVGSQNWLDLFPNSSLYHLPHFGSDHCPLLLQLSRKTMVRRRVKIYHFEAAWLREEGCTEVVDEAWNSNGSRDCLSRIMDRLQLCGESLTRWSRESFGSIPRKIRILRDRLDRLQQLPISNQTQSDGHRISGDLEELIHREEIMWQQRSRTSWLEAGDKNTNFFHRQASQRWRKNRILGIHDEFGVWHEEFGAVESIFTEYFQQLFSSAGPVDATNTLQPVLPIVLAAMNDHLTSPYTTEEVYRAP